MAGEIYQRYSVISKPNIDIAKIEYYIEKDTTQEDDIIREFYPDRIITQSIPFSTNNRISLYSLTEEEATKLRENPSIKSVEVTYPYEALLDPKFPINLTTESIQTGYFIANRGGGAEYAMNSLTVPSLNWGMKVHTTPSGNIDWAKLYSVNLDPIPTIYEHHNQEYSYTATGKGVDVIIIDEGIQHDHPEFLDENGNSRVVKYDWAQHISDLLVWGDVIAEENGLTNGQLPPNFYNNATLRGSHGTKVASTVAGRFFGWAKEATIYDIRVFGGYDSRISWEQAFEAARLFHESKSIDLNTGFKRPTVVNFSAGSTVSLSGDRRGYNISPPPSSILELYYKGEKVNDFIPNSWPQEEYGILYGIKGSGSLYTDSNGDYVQYSYKFSWNTYIEFYSELMEQMVDSGVIFIKSAGNNSSLLVKSGSYDVHKGMWDSYFTIPPSSYNIEDIGEVFTPLKYYYNRLDSPPNAIIVGAIAPYLVFPKTPIQDPNSSLSGSYTYDMFGPPLYISADPVSERHLEDSNESEDYDHTDPLLWYNSSKKGYGIGEPFPGWGNAYSASLAIANFTNIGSGVDIWAAGRDIVEAYFDLLGGRALGSSNIIAKEYGIYDPNYKKINRKNQYPVPYNTLEAPQFAIIESGTSMACPQVAGVACLYAQMNPGAANQEDFKRFLKANAQLAPKMFMENPDNNSPDIGNNYVTMSVGYNGSKHLNLFGAPPDVLYWPYTNPLPAKIS